MAATEKDVQQARKRVDKLNEQLAAERAKGAARIADADNAIRLARLEAEEARLEEELAAAKEVNSAAAVKESVAQTVEQIETGGVEPPADAQTNEGNK